MIRRFLVLGGLNYDIVFQVDRLPLEHEKLRAAHALLAPGGSAANTAFWIGRLGKPVSMLGCVGADPFGSLCLEGLRSAGVDISGIAVSDRSTTGIAAIFTSSESKRMVTARGANEDLDIQALDLTSFATSDHLHFVGAPSAALVDLCRKLSRSGVTISCDFDGWNMEQILEFLDIAFMNWDELRRLLGNDDPLGSAQHLAQSHGTELVVTQGEQGAHWIRAGQRVHCPTTVVEVLDRTGGGDAFNAGFLAARAEEATPTECLRRGLELASRVITQFGPRGYPRLDDAIA